jgi:hypothetical protein
MITSAVSTVSVPLRFRSFRRLTGDVTTYLVIIVLGGVCFLRLYSVQGHISWNFRMYLCRTKTFHVQRVFKT